MLLCCRFQWLTVSQAVDFSVSLQENCHVRAITCMDCRDLWFSGKLQQVLELGLNHAPFSIMLPCNNYQNLILNDWVDCWICSRKLGWTASVCMSLCLVGSDVQRLIAQDFLHSADTNVSYRRLLPSRSFFIYFQSRSQLRRWPLPLWHRCSVRWHPGSRLPENCATATSSFRK